MRQPPALKRAVRAIADGGVVAYPTEGVWGLGCDPEQHAAVAHLLHMKRRPVDKGLILIAADFDALQPYLQLPDAKVMQQVHASWPGPVSWLFAASRYAPAWITGVHDTIAVRVTAHPVARRLCQAWGGALVSTSANRSGEAPAGSASAVRLRFGRTLHAVVPGKLGGRGRPSVLRDAATGTIIRA